VVRRVMDVVIAGVLFVPVMLVVMALGVVMLVVNGRPVFYLSRRIGRSGREFSCIKLCTIGEYEGKTTTLDFRALANANILPMGIFLRDHGFDELPQLINILLGHMSFVGPRPLMPRSFERIRQCNVDQSDWVRAWVDWRLQVTPGLSGWHQTRSACNDMIHYDLEYLRDPSFIRHLQVFAVSVRILMVGKKRHFGWVSAP